MMKIFQIPILNCISCGIIFGVDRGMFCADCRLSLNQAQMGNSLSEDLFPIYSIFNWRPDHNPCVSKLILALKNARAPRAAFDFYAERILHRRIELSMGAMNRMALVPCPSSSGGKDHAWELASSVGRLVQLPILPILKLDKAIQQKSATGDMRQRRRMRLCNNFTTESLYESPDDGPEKHWIFIDDVVTTASTAKAAWRALGRPQNFEVWCIARRWLATPRRL